jgi:hypothetical protein
MVAGWIFARARHRGGGATEGRRCRAEARRYI